tara:strand:+ start:1264 stop:1779 length:516 start_codon:yes stop_codon:yes gene_type:complete
MIKTLLACALVASAPAAQAARYVCNTCNTNEQVTLTFMQERGINDKNALATVLGNIKQESMFHPDICEGGARVRYEDCHKGGYGMIQWTTQSRYVGLGNFAKNFGGDPSTLNTQLRYLVNENQWLKIEPYLKTEGQSIEWYMKHAYTWLGWGVHGNRTSYAYQYLSNLTKG